MGLGDIASLHRILGVGLSRPRAGAVPVPGQTMPGPGAIRPGPRKEQARPGQAHHAAARLIRCIMLTINIIIKGISPYFPVNQSKQEVTR
ncbi:MAG: hypothetical protein JRJ27_00140 [Deltaproteobacteria bacterium]|nr:hypothetical protein [Deltaproteobacteria bacterium]